MNLNYVNKLRPPHVDLVSKRKRKCHQERHLLKATSKTGPSKKAVSFPDPAYKSPDAFHNASGGALRLT